MQKVEADAQRAMMSLTVDIIERPDVVPRSRPRPRVL